jgi:hypothetical protein
MKNKCKLSGIAVVIAAIVFCAALLFTGCGPVDNDNGGSNGNTGGNSNSNDGSGGSGTTFSTMEAFNTWLSKQPKNTRDTPYKVKLNISMDLRKHQLGEWFNEGKYVYLDLSGSTITRIEERTFQLCSTLVGITIGDSVTRIEDKAFCYCGGLTSVIIGNGVTIIGDNAFEQCNRITSLTIGNNVTSIGAEAFYICQNLSSVNIPNSVKSIGRSAFTNCTGITSLTLGNGVTTIGASAFYGCTGLTSVIIPNSVTNLNGFYNCTNLASVTIGNGVTSIGGGAFCGCKSLISITIPSSVKSIGYAAFYDDNGVPYNSIGLTSVTFEGTIPSSGFIMEGSEYGQLPAFKGDLRTKFYETDSANGTPGTYTRPNTSSGTWTKQP